MPLAVSFFDGGNLYNAVSFFLGCVGFVLTLMGLWLTFRQSKGAKDAANQARDAADGAREEVVAIGALVQASQLASLATDVITHLLHKDLGAAAIRSNDLRGGVSQFRASKIGKAALAQSDWQDLVAKIASVYDYVTELRSKNSTDNDAIQRCVVSMGSVSATMNELVSTTREQTLQND